MLNLIISGIVLIETNPAILFSTRHKKPFPLQILLGKGFSTFLKKPYMALIT
jgi:hypothetical protein